MLQHIPKFSILINVPFRIPKFLKGNFKNIIFFNFQPAPNGYNVHETLINDISQPI